jgi:hypothetical protein
LNFDTRKPGHTTSPVASTGSSEHSPADADVLLCKEAHRVLVHHLPGAALPDELSRVRAMLDAHMFGRDKRAQRDDVVEVARLIDRLAPARVE